MYPRVLILCSLAALAVSAAAERKPLRIVLVGDSTVNDDGGWGPGFRASFASDVTVINLARNGRSSKSFRAEGSWGPAIEARPDYVILQFGHNDIPGKGPDRETDSKTTYREDLARYVDDARAAGATPVLATSIVRRLFTDDGHFRPGSLVPYVEAVRALAAQKNVALMDLYELTRAQSEKLGPAGCRMLNARTADGKPDTAHLGPRGQMEVGKLAALEFARAVPAMKPYLRQETPAAVRVVVAQDGSGDFPTIQRAIDHAPTVTGGQRLVIEIRPGTYRERVMIPQDRARVTVRGADAATTVVTAGMSAKTAGGTFFSATVEVQGSEFEAENITFENTFGTGSQAVAISVHSDRAVFRKCRFTAWQDTLYAAHGRQYYQDCYIEGHVDFIFGNAAAVFSNCEIHSRGAGYITAHSRTLPGGSTGFVFDHCRITGSDTGKGVFLGRPWRPYSRVAFLECFVGDHIRPEGWDNWGDAANEKTAWYGESGSTGPGASAAQRVPWARPLTAGDAAMLRALLRGNDGWDPASTP